MTVVRSGAAERWRAPRGGRLLLAVAVVAAAAAAGWLAWGRSGSHDHPYPGLSNASVYRAIVRHADFPFHLPAVGARTHAVDMGGYPAHGRGDMIEIDYRSSATGAMFGLLEGRQRRPVSLIQATAGRRPLGRLTIRGRVWTRYRQSDPVLATVMPDGVQVVVRGWGSWRSLAAFAATVPSA
jgi:hypothetical protein